MRHPLSTVAIRLACTLAPLAAGAMLMTSATPSGAADRLATPMVVEDPESQWPVEVGLEIGVVAADGAPGAVVVPGRKLLVPDGHALAFSDGIDTPHGRRRFELRVTPHRHPDARVELDWALEIEDAEYRPFGLGGYVLHRLRLGPPPPVGPLALRVARADIVSTDPTGVRERVEIDGVTYEIRMFARGVRG